MIKESYTERYYTYHSKYISNVLALRPPQEQSLDYFAKLCDIISLQKNPTTMQQIIEENEEEYNALPTLEKKDKFLHDKASAIALDFYAEDLKNAQELIN